MDEPAFRKHHKAKGPATTTLSVSTLLCIAVSLVGHAYPEEPPAGHTGGFNEPTCRRCHFGEPINAPAGTLVLQGVPKNYSPDSTYSITLTLSRAGIASGGFQLAARFVGGHRAGHQAGYLQAPDERVEVIAHGPLRIQYAQHTKAGTELTASDSVRWMVDWTSPSPSLPDASVAFHVAANASNDDASEFGDYVYVAEVISGGEESSGR